MTSDAPAVDEWSSEVLALARVLVTAQATGGRSLMDPIGDVVGMFGTELLWALGPVQWALGELVGKPERARVAAQTWREQAERLRTVEQQYRADSDALPWQGTASDAYRRRLEQLLAQAHAGAVAAGTLATSAEAVSDFLEAVAETAKSQVADLLSEMVATALVASVVPVGGQVIGASNVIGHAFEMMEALRVLKNEANAMLQPLRMMYDRLDEVFAQLQGY